MKFRLSTFLLIVGLIAVLTGWAVERRYYASRLVDETEREGAISSTLSTALFTNMIYSQLDNLSDAEFARKRNMQLINNVVFLFIHRDNAVDRTIVQTATYTQRKEQTTAILREGGRSLELLGVDSESGFALQIREAGFVDEWTEGLIGTDGQLDNELSDFVSNCLNYRQHYQLSFEQNRTAEQTLMMAECAMNLYEGGVFDDNKLFHAQLDLEELTTDPNGRKSALLERLNSLR